MSQTKSRASARSAAARWAPMRPVPWPDTGDPHLDLLRAAVEQGVYPYGDLETSPGRCVRAYQVSLIASGRSSGMSDAQVYGVLSACVRCGMTSVYADRGVAPKSRGTLLLVGCSDPPDAMGRAGFYWIMTAHPDTGTEAALPAVTWERGDVADAFRRAFAIPTSADSTPADGPLAIDPGGQTTLF